ncbi:MAG: S8 family serine peptidase [Nitrospira sp.]|nr:S8 family serine peptidase [Nitrospira sp.]
MDKSTRTSDKKTPALRARPTVVIRFGADVHLSDRSDLGEQIQKLGIGPWKKLIKEFPELRLSRVFPAKTRGELTALVRRAMDMDPTYIGADFDAFFRLEGPPETDFPALVAALLRWHSVVEAYIEHPGPDPAVNAANDPRFPSQIYLDPAPDGIDAEYAWNFAGGDGAGQNIIDLERGWTLSHEDLAAHGITLLHGTNLPASRGHGAAVLGVVCALDNALGGVGVVPNLASVRVVSYEDSTIGDAILAAIGALRFGDLLLVEAQVKLYGSHVPIGQTARVQLNGSILGPIDAYDGERELIRLATALGIVVVEVAGNGSGTGMSPPALSLDTYQTQSGHFVFDRNPAAPSPDLRDSGAIIVTAATSAAPHTRLNYAAHGWRIDCYAWGENIDTSGFDGAAGSVSAYSTAFCGTSGAAAIVAGAALAVQGRAQAQLGFRFSPRQLRAILSNPATGTAPSATETTRIGVMPNLRAIFNTVLNAAPDLYLRDFVGDVGDPHAGAISASPDIILRPTAEVDPQATFGPGSGTENDPDLGTKAEIGQDNFVYVRVLNRGGSAATNVQTTVYWSPVSTLVTPDLWTKIGTATLPSVPMGNQLTVSPGIVWHQADIPAAGHYCFVGLIGNALDPAPDPTDFMNWDNFERFIRENNNVTWRNFNVEDSLPDTEDDTVPSGFKSLNFIVPGAPDRARYMSLEFISSLPDGAKAMVEVPQGLYERLNIRHQLGGLSLDLKRRVGLIRINPQGRTRFGKVLLPAKSRHALRLLVFIPEKNRSGVYQIAARQLWEGAEMGRVTWQFGGKPRENRG